MPIKDPLPVHNFPQDLLLTFPKDNDYLVAALAEWNQKHKAKLKFDQLDREARTEVLTRAQRMKDGM